MKRINNIMYCMVLFIGDYYIANSYKEEYEAILEWYNSNDYNTLLIIDKYNRIDRYKEMRGDLYIPVMLLTNGSIPDEGEKSIFINEVFGNTAQDFVVEYSPMVGFFRG